MVIPCHEETCLRGHGALEDAVVGFVCDDMERSSSGNNHLPRQAFEGFLKPGHGPLELRPRHDAGDLDDEGGIEEVERARVSKSEDAPGVSRPVGTLR